MESIKHRTAGLSIVLLLWCLLTFGRGDSRLTAQDESRGVGARPTVLFGPLADKAPSGNAGLFVGVNQFTRDDGLNELAYAVHDAIELAHLFVFELKLMPASNCYLLLSGEPASDAAAVKQHLAQLKAAGAKISGADRSKILLTFLDLRKFGKDESNLFVCSFSSHGFNEGRTAYVMPSDGHRELLSDTAVPLETIETKMEDSKAGHRLLLVDACQERVSARGSSSAGKAANAAFIDALKKPSGQAKLASCSPGEFSFEHGSLGGVGHGVFTHSFLEALRGGAKPDKENLVRLGSVSEYVAANVSAWTKELGRSAQTPFLESPVDARKLPLATKADDLTSLVASVQRAPLTGGLTIELRERLVKALLKANPGQAADRQFVSSTRDFVQGRFNASLFIPYATRELDRLLPVPPALLVAPFSSNAALAAQEAWSKFLGQRIDVTNSIGMKLKLIPAGEFMMGSGLSAEAIASRFDSEASKYTDEHPRHRVRITQAFYLGQHEVTVGQFREFVRDTGYRTEAESDGKGGRAWLPSTNKIENRREWNWQNPSFSQGDNHPVVQVSWNDAMAFCKWLSEQDGVEYRLPSEAEWEYSCRAGTTTLYQHGDNPEGLVYVGNVADKAYLDFVSKYNLTKSQALRASDGAMYTAAVGRYRANGFGVYDMHGNVWEWCSDWYGSDYYKASPMNDPRGPSRGSLRVYRGGSWVSTPQYVRSANRSRNSPDDRSSSLGFRVLRSSVLSSQ